MAEEHYLGNPLLKKANTQIEFTQEQIIEFAKCAKDPVYFAKNYMQIVTLDHGLQPFDMYPFQEKMLTSFHENRFNICKLPRQSGKALSLDTPIPTPNGWTTMGELSIGDKILSPNGNSVSVTMKTETMYNHVCYKIYFDNGEEIIADADHLWEVNSSYWTSGKKVVTTKDIFDAYENKKHNKRGKGVVGSYFIEFTKPIENFSEDNLPIDPYLLGVWLGDGYSSDSRVISHKDDFSFYKSRIEIQYERSDNNCIRFKVLDLQKKLKENNLLNNKHIPQVYLRASYKHKLELLRGLMDTDGSLKPNTRSFEFYQKDYNFSMQVVELLSSMGIKSRIRVKLIKDCLYHTVSFTTTERVFNLPRKYNLINNNKPPRPQDKRVYIQKLEKVDSVPVACISVDSNDQLFLCGKTFIPTHNSTTVVSYLLHYAIFNDNVNIAILANKAQTARDLLGRLQTGYENLPKWLQQGICSWNKGSLELENGSKIFAASTSASSVRGSTYNIIFLDEFAFVPNQVADSFFSSVYPTITSGKSSKVIVVSCVTKDTYLLTDNGYRKIETLIDPNKEGAYFTPTYTVRGNNKFYTSDVIVNNKKSPTNIIKTRYEEIECSQDHKLWAFKDGKYGYVESKNLSVGDYIALKYNQQIFGNDDYVGYNPEKGKSKNLFSCDYINEDIAYFIGLYIAEGYARNIINKNTGNNKGGQVIISCGDDISESLNKLNVPHTKIDDVHYVINSKQLIEFIQLLGFDISKKATEKVLPNKVLSWSKKNIVSLLRGMFDGDGCITKRGRITYTSTSRELTRQVQLLLANLGIIGSIYETTSKPTKLVKVYSTHYTIEIAGSYASKYFDEVGFGLSRKQDRISYLKTSTRSGNNNDIIPDSSTIIEDNKNSDIRKLKLKSGRSKTFKNYSRQFLLQKKQDLYECSNEILKEFLDDNVQEDMIWLKIKDIQKSENEVFDVSLPDIEEDKWAHSVLYNNFLGHQTPKGLNHFYKLWDDAKKGKNEYVPIEVFWTDVPGRDENFKKTTIANTSESQWRQEFESVSSETLVEIKDGNTTKTVTIGELYNNILKS